MEESLMPSLDSEPKLKIQTAEDTIFEVGRPIADKLNLLKDCWEVGSPIKILEVTAPIMEKVLEYCEKYAQDKDKKNTDESIEQSEWDSDFINVDKETLFELALVCFSFIVYTNIVCLPFDC